MTNNKVIVNKRVKINAATFIDGVEASIPSAQKILSVTASSRLTSCEALNGEIKAAGKIIVKIIYLDSENRVESYERATDFLSSVSAPELIASYRVVLSSRVTEVAFSGTANINIQVTHELSGYYISEGSLSFLECNEEDIRCLTTAVKVESISALGGALVTAAQSFEAKRPLAKILAYSSDCWLNNTVASEGQYQIEGEILTNIIALDTNGELLSQTFMLPFAGEFSEASLTADAELVLDCFAKSTTITIESEGSVNLILDVEAEIKGCAITSTEINGISDAYSTMSELVLHSNTARLDSNICYRRVRERVSGTANIDDGALRSIECILSPSTGSVGTGNGFGLTVEGIVSTSVVYSTHEGTTGSVVIEAPYQISVTQDYSCDVDLMPNVIIAGCNAKITGSSEIEATFDLIVTVRGIKEEEVTLLDGIEYGVDKETDNVAISLYIAQRGESLWNIAKELSADEDVLLKQNPNIKLPLQGGEKILLYRSL